MRALILAAVFAAASIGCRDRDDLQGARRALPGLAERAPSFETPGRDRLVAYDFIDNRASAVVVSDGALRVEMGTPDAAKYTEGSFRSLWHDGSLEDDPTARVALIDGLAGELFLPLDRDLDGALRDREGKVTISIRARASAPRQLVSVFMNERRLGDISMPGVDWQTYQIRVPDDALLEGENKLRFYFRHAADQGGVRTAAAFSAMAIGRAARLESGVALRAVRRARGGTELESLEVASASRLSYYLSVPRGKPRLALAAAGDGGELAIRIAGSGRTSTETLWSATATNAWQAAEVDLSGFSGEIVRVDFASSGPASWGEPRIVLADHQPAAAAELRQVDRIIVWAVSSLRADRLSSARAPAMSRAAARGLSFERARTWSPTPGAAHAAMLTGRRQLSPRTSTTSTPVAERLRRAGYTTVLVSGNGFVNDDGGFAAGFDVYKNPMRQRRPHGAGVLWRLARKALAAQRDRRIFFYIAPAEPHVPYTPSSSSLEIEWSGEATRISPAKTAALSELLRDGRERLTVTEKAFITALYDASVRDVDAGFAEMIADLEEQGLLEGTAIILVGDHGEALFERGSFGHGIDLHEESLRIPLAVVGPGLAPRRVAEVDVDSLDVAATCLELAGLPPDPQSQGGGLVGLANAGGFVARPIFSHAPMRSRSLTLGRYKLIVPVRGARELFELAQDPAESSSIADSRQLVMRYMRNVFGLGVAYESAWSLRWGAANNLAPAFAADHGI